MMRMSHIMTKPVYGGFRPGKTQTGLFSNRDKLESQNFGFSKDKVLHYLAMNNKGADQTVRVRRLICVFDVRIWHKTNFLW